MKRVLFGAAMMLAAIPIGAAAQGRDQPVAKCMDAATVPTQAQDVCQKAVDLFDYMMPQLGTAMAGGNPTLGQGTTLGGLPHFQIGLRVTAVKGTVPKLDEPGAEPAMGAPVRTNYLTEDAPIPMPAVDVSLGIFDRLPIPVIPVGGLDVMLSAAYVPSFEEEGIKIDVDSPLRLGFGARIGLLRETGPLPSVTFSYLQRGIPKIDLTTIIEDGTSSAFDDTISVKDFEVSAQSWRLIASKRFVVLTVAIGVGQDSYDSEANLSAVVNEPLVGRAAFGEANGDPAFGFDQEVTRTSYFLNLKLFGVAAEIGQVSGGDIVTYNTFETEPDAARLYASLGFRFGF